jgi:hypothetical protein
LIDPISPDDCHTKGYIKGKGRLQTRLFYAAMGRSQPQPEDLAKALAFVGQYRKQYGYERRDCKLELACLSMETILAISLPGWIDHRDGIEEGCLKRLISVQAVAA